MKNMRWYKNKWVGKIKKLILFLCIFSWFIFLCPLHPMLVSGNSMEPTLKDGQTVIGIHSPKKIKYQELIVAYIPELQKTIIKRVYGMPGDTIQITNGLVYRNGTLVEKEGGYPSDTETDLSVTLKMDEYFVLGDNRSVSYDSRSRDIGMIKQTDIRYKIVWYL